MADDSQPEPSSHNEPPAKEELEDLDALDAQLSALNEKAQAARQRMPNVPDWEYKRPQSGPGSKPDYSDKDNYRGLGLGITAAYLLVGFMIVGFGLGYLVNKVFKTANFEVILGMAGAVAGIAMIIYLTNKDDQRKN